MRLLSLLLFLLLLSTCRQDDDLALPCSGDQVNEDFVVNYTPRYWVSDPENFKMWGFLSDDDGKTHSTVRFNESTLNTVSLEQYCPLGMNFTTCHIREQDEGSYYITLRTMAAVNNYSQLTESYIWGYRRFTLNAPIITDLPEDVEEVSLVSLYNRYSVEIYKEERIAQLSLNNLAAQEWLYLRITTESDPLGKGLLYRPHIMDELISYQDFDLDIASHTIELPFKSRWSYSIVGVINDDYDQKVLLYDSFSKQQPLEQFSSITIDLPENTPITEYLVTLTGGYEAPLNKGVRIYKSYKELPDQIDYEYLAGEFSCEDASCTYSADSKFTFIEGRWYSSFLSSQGESININWFVYFPAQSGSFDLPEPPNALTNAYPFLLEMSGFSHQFYGYRVAPAYENQLTRYEMMGIGEDPFWRVKKHLSQQELSD